MPLSQRVADCAGGIARIHKLCLQLYCSGRIGCQYQADALRCFKPAELAPMPDSAGLAHQLVQLLVSLSYGLELSVSRTFHQIKILYLV